MNIQEFEEKYNILVEATVKKISEYWNEYLKLSPEYKFSIDETQKSIIENDRGGYVYFMKNKYNGYVKIGFTNNIASRLNNIRSICKNYFGEIDAIELLGLVDTSFIKPVEFENFLHKKYKHYNVFGEWFNFPKDVWDEIEQDYLFDFDYDDTIRLEDLEKLNLRRNQLHGIGFVGNPSDKEFMNFLYGRYNNINNPISDDIKQLSEQLLNDVYDLKYGSLTKRIFNQSFYHYAFQRYLEDMSKTFCAMCEAYDQSPTEMFQQTTPKIKA